MAKLIKLEELNKTDIFLCKRKSSEKTIWDLCRILNTTPVMNSANNPVITVRFLDGLEKQIFVREQECSDNFGELVLKKLPKNYFENETQKLNDTVSELQKKIDMLTQLKNS
jgi:hypothetical protein